ncbi:MAG: beta-L-arabinofuranosidase domain-containing protein, partial [Thermoguttaceae bacterium]
MEEVNRGGNSFLYWQTKPPKDFLAWAHSHMGRALVAWYEASGDRRILDALVKVYAEYPVPMGRLRFDAGDTYIVSGLCNLDAMLESYRLSGDRRILERARAALDVPEVQTALGEWACGQLLPGHAVCAYEQIRLPALFYLATGQPKCLKASLEAFRWFDGNHLLPYGVASGEEFLSGVGALRCTETCDVVAAIWSNVWLYRLTGERSFGDSVERAFFNAGPAPIARDFRTMSYYQSPNR